MVAMECTAKVTMMIIISIKTQITNVATVLDGKKVSTLIENQFPVQSIILDKINLNALSIDYLFGY